MQRANPPEGTKKKEKRFTRVPCRFVLEPLESKRPEHVPSATFFHCTPVPPPTPSSPCLHPPPNPPWKCDTKKRENKGCPDAPGPKKLGKPWEEPIDGRDLWGYTTHPRRIQLATVTLGSQAIKTRVLSGLAPLLKITLLLRHAVLAPASHE